MNSILVFASLALSVLAQRATIISPAEGTTITSGSHLVIDIHQRTLLPMKSKSPLPQRIVRRGHPGQPGVGAILYKGDLNPQFDPSEPRIVLHQNFTVEVPEVADQGPCVISLTRLEMVGAVKEVLLETSGIVVTLV